MTSKREGKRELVRRGKGEWDQEKRNGKVGEKGKRKVEGEKVMVYEKGIGKGKITKEKERRGGKKRDKRNRVKRNRKGRGRGGKKV
jgi:hypothetical protein